jgi:hypothetical protein
MNVKVLGCVCRASANSMGAVAEATDLQNCPTDL